MPIVTRLDLMMALRGNRGTELSERMGVTQANLSKLRTGKVKAVRFSTLEKLRRPASESRGPIRACPHAGAVVEAGRGGAGGTFDAL